MVKTPEIRGLNSLYLAGKVVPENAPKLLIVMHGLGDSLDGYRVLPDLLRIDELGYLLLNAPDPYFTGYSWFDIYGDMTMGIRRSRGALFGVLEQLEDQGWAAKDIGLFGFSQGCLMALDVACRYPKTLGAVVGVSGFVGFLEEYPEQISPVARTQKILVTHGSADPMLPLASTKQQIMALKGMGLSIEWREYRKEHTIDPRDEVAEIRGFLRRTLMKT